MQTRILIADDDAQQRRYLSAILQASGYAVETADGGKAAVATLTGASGAQIGLTLLDLHMPDLDGLSVLARIREAKVQTPVLVLTSDGSVARAVEAMQAGAQDFLAKPVAPERLEVSIRNALAMSELTTEVRRLSRKADNRLSFEELIAVAPSTREVIALARRAARSDIPVLIEGESGTGKEVFARAIHGESERAGGAFIAVNCGALPANLVESILFGHEKGAFTGATAKQVGKFQEASGGTLFLDEVGDLPPDAQVKLLRAIQTGEVDAVGAAKPTKVDIRLISATNRDLSGMIAEGRFREDLYYRISVFPMALPPLRERREDIPGLARMFLHRIAAAEGIPVESFSQNALETITAAEWPGNVRQLENTIHRAVVLSNGSQIQADDLIGLTAGGLARSGVQDRGAAQSDADAGGGRCFIEADGHIRRLVDIEADAIKEALRLYRGRMSETARRLGIGRSTLYRKIDELRIEKLDTAVR
ncbi:MAG: sigma-54 dependent transcriptional regulator [Pseudomonadota bacterium]